MSALIELKDARKSYRTSEIETHALRGLDLEIHAGDYIALTGPSGCGKSTLLNVLGLLDDLSAGQHKFAGQDVSQLSFDERSGLRNKSIGFVFQSFHLLADLTVQENVELPARYARPARPQGVQKRATELLERVGMAHRAKHRPAQLSGGQQQRVAIARAMLLAPSILLLDEPTGNLDGETSESVMELLTELHNKDSAIVLVTHEPEFAARARRVVQLRDGQLVQV